MQRTLSALSAAIVGLAMLLGSAISSFAAPVPSQPVQVTSNIEQVRSRDRYRPYYRHGWDNRRNWNRSYHRYNRNWGRSHWGRSDWERRNVRTYRDRRWRENQMGGSGRSHQ
ncbi:hypothetical protein SAMN05428967_3291 [Phyllobacterium sp. YR620]|uniref:hypothetical protein n=1 Tax=Phyllobacterium sp. YR620 TaxID=1881066 RepID=UPI0008907367|nr:hypothetical protein [Phyllobacterium sp. YR620]SDP73620.1 hypothetical protein SAMN05428967_3291 [Phyllobacterium sp. YR620]